MINHNIEARNFGPVQSLNWDTGDLNIVIGENGTGKTFLLKALYSAARACEEYHGDRTFQDVLSPVLLRTFQTRRLADLVCNEGNGPLHLSLDIDDERIGFDIAPSADQTVDSARGPTAQRQATSVFLPAEDILSHGGAAHDVLRDLTAPPRTDLEEEFAEIRDDLLEIARGELALDNGAWTFNHGSHTYPVNQVSGGVKRVAALARLISGKVLDRGSLLFIDEPEAGLHPAPLCRFMDALAYLSRYLNVFIATNSYEVITNGHIHLLRDTCDVSYLSLREDGTALSSYKRMPDNSIIQASVALQEELKETKGWADED